MIGAALILLFASIFLLAGPRLLARFGTESLRDFRLKIFADSLLFVRSSPWTGAGLGSFAEIFPLYRRASVIPQRIIHPESDWLWLAAETGLPGCAAAALLLAHAVLRPGLRLTISPDRPLRIALGLSSLGFLVHSAVDVPAHRLGTVIPALLVFALATSRGEERAAPSVSRWFLRFPALAVLCSGLLCTVAILARWTLPFADGAVLLTRQAQDDLGAGRDQAALAAIDRALAWTPLDWRAHFTRAVAEQRLGHFTAALRDFRQARFLEPDFAGLPLDEALAWLDISPRLALDAFLEALRRNPAESRPALFQRILAVEYPHPELRGILWHAAASSPNLPSPYLGFATPGDLSPRLAEILRGDPELHTFDSAARQRLFSVWMEKGDAPALVPLLAAHPDWLKDAWRPLADYQASRQNFAAAAGLYTRWLPPPKFRPPSPVSPFPMPAAVSRSILPISPPRSSSIVAN